MLYDIKYNNGTGALPVSLYVLIRGKMKDILGMWDKIQEYSIRDVIFHGDIYQNYEELNLLNSRLISAGYHTSVIIPSSSAPNFTDFFLTRRLIVFFSSHKDNATKYFKPKMQAFQSLSENDVLVLEPASLKETLFLRQTLINKGIKATIMIKLNDVDVTKDSLLKAKIYDLYIYDGEMHYV